MILRLLLNPWFVALSAGALAAFLGWVALHQRDAKRDAQAALRASESVIATLNEYAVTVQDIEATLRDGMEALADVPDTQGCGPAVGIALDRLRLTAP